MNGYKVRLEDGSEIGPLDLAGVRSWYNDGLLKPESLVLPPGGRRWTRLSQAIDIRSWGGLALKSSSRRKAGATSPGARTIAPSAVREPLLDRLRPPLTGTLVLAMAVLCAFWNWRPEHARAAVRGWPWLEVGLGLMAFGLSLFIRLRLTHVLATTLICMGGLTTVGLSVLFFLQQAPLVVHLLLAAALGICAGLLVLLWGYSASLLRTLLGALLAIAGIAGVLRVAYLPGEHIEAQLHRFTLQGTEIAEPQRGLRVALPPGWRLVSTDAPFLHAPTGALAAVARADGTAFAFLTAETAPRGELRLDPLLEQQLAARQRVLPTLTPLERADLKVGDLPARRLLGASSSGTPGSYELILVWRAGLTHYALVGWGTAGHQNELVTSFEPLIANIRMLDVKDEGLTAALATARQEVPFLSPAMSERLMALSDGGLLDAPALFRRAQELAGRGAARLTPEEVRDLTGLLDQAYRRLGSQERKRLGEYLARLRSGSPVSVEDDRLACSILRDGVSALPDSSRQRLQDLYDAALTAALATP